MFNSGDNFAVPGGVNNVGFGNSGGIDWGLGNSGILNTGIGNAFEFNTGFGNTALRIPDSGMRVHLTPVSGTPAAKHGLRRCGQHEYGPLEFW